MMKAEIDSNGELTIKIPTQTPSPSKTGKTLVVASSHGNQPTTVMIDGKWKPGDHFYTASGDGGAFYGTTDIGDLAVECREKWHAEENAMTWLADLSEREKDLSAAWVTEYVVISVDDSGKIGEARSVKNGCNEVHRR